MADLPNLKAKVGPLPAVVWAGAVAAIYVIYRYMKVGRAPKRAATVDPSTQYSVGGQGSNPNAYTNATGTFNSGQYGSPSTSALSYVEPAISTNETWRQRALNWLIAQNVAPADAYMAIDSFIYGTGAALNSSQSAALAQAQTHFGATPQPTGQLPGVAVPHDGPGPPPVIATNPNETSTPPPLAANPPPVNPNLTYQPPANPVNSAPLMPSDLPYDGLVYL